MPRKVFVTDPALFAKRKIKEETKEEEAARIAKRQLAAGQDVATRTGEHYVVDRKIGSGRMGEVYQVHPVHDPDLKFAMKTEGNRDDAPDKSLLRLKCETFVYNQIAKANPKEIDKSHYVNMIDAGMTDEVKFFIMDLVWRPLHTVICDMLNWELSAHTKVSIARQTLKGIEGLHTIGFVHRDVKPSNFAVGRPPHEKIIYTIDFGSARDYFDKKGRMKVAREKVIFMGATLRYAAIAGLEEKEQGRREDLEGWLYMMMELYDRKNLAWRDLGWDKRSECIRMKKEIFKHAKFGVPHMRLPHAYYDIIHVVGNMRYYLKDDRYLTGEIEQIQEILDLFVKTERIDMSLPLDWETVGGERAARRKEKDEKGVKIPDSGTDRKKKMSKSESKEKRRRQTRTDAYNSTRSESDTPNSLYDFDLHKQRREEWRKENHHKKSRDKKKRSRDGVKTSKDGDEKEKKAEDKTIDERNEMNEKKERKKDKEKEDDKEKSGPAR